jgi:DNA-binding GntR family transcriptional regulator
MLFMEQIQHVDLPARVYKKVKAMILNNELLPGQKILQEKLADQLGISRTPLLRVLQMLESEFLVESIPRRGLFVKKMSSKELLDAFDVREGFESIAARLAAEKITTVQVVQLKNLFQPFSSNPDAIDLSAYKKADLKFHDTLVRISENQIMIKMEIFSNMLLISNQMGLVRSPLETLKEHLALIDALEKHDAREAEKVIRNHIKKSRILLAEVIEKEN